MSDELDNELSPPCAGRRRCPRQPGPCSRRGAGCRANPTNGVGVALRALRETRQLSLKELAKQSGLAVNTLSLIENGKTSPSVNTLQQLALTLGIPITAFFEHDPTVRQVVHTQASQRIRMAFDHGAIEDLGLGLSNCPLEPVLVTLAPHAGSACAMVAHTGYEFVLGLAGCVAYTLEQQIYLLYPGDSLLFAAVLPHCWQNMSATEARLLVLFCPDRDSYHTASLHFRQ